MSESKKNNSSDISFEWEMQPNGCYKRCERVQVKIEFQKSFVDDSDFMPNINGISENLNGTGCTPLYDFNSKDEEFDNRVMVAIRDKSLDVTEIDAIIAHEEASMSAQFDNAKEAVTEELEKIKSEALSSESSTNSDNNNSVV